MFGTTGYCAACDKVIPAFELVMRAKNNVYHLECFACQQCSHRFCVGDKFYLYSNQIMCEVDYEEALLITQSQPIYGPPANLYPYAANNPFSITSQTPKQCMTESMPFLKEESASSGNSQYNALQELKHQTENISIQHRGTDDSSSGYGSPSPTTMPIEKY